jgi:hypothetical protein
VAVPLYGIDLRANVFFACGWLGLLIFLRNEKKQCAKCGRIAKSVTEKKQRRVESAEVDKRTVQAQRYEGRGLLAAGDLPCGATRD